MFRKRKIKAIITAEQGNEYKQAKGNVTGEPLPIQLTQPISVERLTIVQTGDSVVVALGNNNEILNIEIKG